MPLFLTWCVLKQVNQRKTWRHFQQVHRLHCRSMEQRGQWNADLPLSHCQQIPRPLSPGQLCRKRELECWTNASSPKGLLRKLEWGSQRAEVLAEFKKAGIIWGGTSWYFWGRKFLTSFASKGFGVILFVEWESCWIPSFWSHTEVLRHPGLHLSIRAFRSRVWQVVSLMKNNGQSTLCSGSSRFADDSQVMFVAHQRDLMLLTKKPKAWSWGHLYPHLPLPWRRVACWALWGWLSSWKTELGCSSEG